MPFQSRSAGRAAPRARACGRLVPDALDRMVAPASRRSRSRRRRRRSTRALALRPRCRAPPARARYPGWRRGFLHEGFSGGPTARSYAAAAARDQSPPAACAGAHAWSMGSPRASRCAWPIQSSRSMRPLEAQAAGRSRRHCPGQLGDLPEVIDAQRVQRLLDAGADAADELQVVRSPSGPGSGDGGMPRTGSTGGGTAAARSGSTAGTAARGSALACRWPAALASLSSCSSLAMRSRLRASACSSSCTRRPERRRACAARQRLSVSARLRAQLGAQAVAFFAERLGPGVRGCDPELTAPRASAAREPSNHEAERRSHDQETTMARTDPMSSSPHARTAGLRTRWAGSPFARLGVERWPADLRRPCAASANRPDRLISAARREPGNR